MINVSSRIMIVAVVFALLGGAIVLRLGYLQLMQYDYFSVLADESHLRKFEIPAQRGEIFMQDRGELAPVAMNRNRKTLYADTRYIYDEARVLSELEEILGVDYSADIGNANGYIELEKEVGFHDAEAIEDRELSGVGLSDNYVREYPEDELASQALGFVSHDGEGQYGIEEFYNRELTGTPGLFDAQTDSQGVPLATDDNVRNRPQPGSDVVLNLDRNIQAFVESSLQAAVRDMDADSAHAVIMEVNTGAVVGMGNYPAFDPNRYSETRDYGVFQNTIVSSQFEPGSGLKMFTMAAGLDSGAVETNTTYRDDGSIEVAGHEIRNVLAAQGTTTMREVVIRSLNTGAVYVLEALGGGDINDKAKETLHEYFAERFDLDERTGVDLPGENDLSMHQPGAVGRVEYANMAFGQGIVTTMIRMTTSMGGLVNDGTMYRPRLVDYHENGAGVTRFEPEVLADAMITPETSKELRDMMEGVVEEGGGYGAGVDGYRIGGKTGTAEIPDGEGGYMDGSYIGTFTGFAPVEDPEYVMMVRLDDPDTTDFAGNDAARVFGDIMEEVLHYSGVPSSD